jgi:hypothetical protein
MDLKMGQSSGCVPLEVTFIRSWGDGALDFEGVSRMISLIVEGVDFGVPSKNLWDTTQRGAGEFLTETDLHYSLFPSRVTFEIGGIVVIGPRRRVPLFDFLVCVTRLAKALYVNESTSIGFTEAADRIYFRPLNGGGVEVSDSESGLLVQTDRVELVVALEEFLSNGRTQLLENVPGIQRNPHMVKLVI